jgi:hypothetical protein
MKTRPKLKLEKIYFCYRGKYQHYVLRNAFSNQVFMLSLIVDQSISGRGKFWATFINLSIL